MTKNFALREFACPCCGGNDIQDIVIYKIQSVRDFLKEPIIISSAFRCKKHNIAVGGSETSSHVLGLALDIIIPSSTYGFKFIEAIIVTNSFTRIGYGKKGGKIICHVDKDPNKISPVLWGY